ncbi:MAG TPA: DUF4339 domain-containing protein [Xanthobacteraceae bacterium]|nr:DUF4339 domain-containing protein [Xanthobacteraceae bacterium]
MSDSWYYVERGETKGPVSLDELRRYLGALSDWRAVLVWKEGFEDWKAAGSSIFPPPVRQSKARNLPAPRSAISRDEGSPRNDIEEPKGQKPSWIKRAVLLVAPIFAAIVAGVVAKTAVKEAMAPSSAQLDTAIERALAQLEAETRPTLPKKVDNVTTWISLSHEGRKVIYGHRIELARSELDWALFNGKSKRS